MSIIAGSHEHGTGIPGTRNRHVRTVAITAVILILFWTIRNSPLFKPHYESGFHLVNPSKVNPDTTTTIVQGPPPIALPGDDFYITDALHHALNPAPPPPPPPPPARAFPDSVAVIMETDVTRVANLVPITLHFANLLGPKWPVVVLTLKSTWIEPPSPTFRRLMAERRIRIHFLPEATTFPDHSSVSVFLTQPWFWEQFESADRVLLFQADSILCSKSASRVDDFAEWDLIGAPISSRYGVGFNGGLSLRNPKLMLSIARNPPHVAEQENIPAAAVGQISERAEGEGEVTAATTTTTTTNPDSPAPIPEKGISFETSLHAYQERVEKVRLAQGKEAADEEARRTPSWQKFEDQWFYKMLEQVEGARLPSTEVARTFSVETVWYDTPLGYHQPFRWLTEGQKQKVVEWCPEVAMLQDASHFF